MPKKKLKAQKRELRNGMTLKRAILAFMSESPRKQFNYKQIGAGAGLAGVVTQKTIMSALAELAREGRIEEMEHGKYRMKLSTRSLTGRLEVTREGSGFVVFDDETEDLFIPPRSLGKALHGDLVEVKLTRAAGVRKGGYGRSRAASQSSRAEGEIISIVERGNTKFVGTIEIVNRVAIIEPDDARIHTDFLIKGNDLKGAQDGDKVIFEMVEWERHTPDASIIKVLGKGGEHETEMHAILFQFGFIEEFPVAVEAEVAAIPDSLPADEIANRRDFRSITTFTIDPVDAKDFDDAISFRKLENGHFEIGVHIADVSWYVRPGTELDNEAFNRATSVYLVDRTVPMLPERLSNNLCSLRPNEDRFTFTAVFEMSLSGHVFSSWYGRTVIHSDKRFTYEEAQDILDKGEGLFHEELKTLNTIAYALRDQRFREGSINFEEDEVKFELDEKGVPVRVFRKVRRDTNKLIEDFMLLANRKVGEYVAKLRKTPPLSFIWRVHDSPDSQKLEALQGIAEILGYELDLSSPRAIIRTLNALLTAVEGKPEQNIISSVAVRAMAKAMYQPENIGHYGLGFEFYTHFTSPIRRYPDLMVHRFMAQYLDGDLNYKAATRLAAQSKHCSLMEKKAADAERASVKYKQVEYLLDKIGKQFPGIISGVTRWGIYVVLDESKSEGMIPFADLQDDYYDFDEERFRVVGRNTGNTINLGDKVIVEIRKASLALRQIDMHLIEITEQPKHFSPDSETGNMYVAKRNPGGESGAAEEEIDENDSDFWSRAKKKKVTKPESREKSGTHSRAGGRPPRSSQRKTTHKKSSGGKGKQPRKKK